MYLAGYAHWHGLEVPWPEPALEGQQLRFQPLLSGRIAAAYQWGPLPREGCLRCLWCSRDAPGMPGCAVAGKARSPSALEQASAEASSPTHDGLIGWHLITVT